MCHKSKKTHHKSQSPILILHLESVNVPETYSRKAVKAIVAVTEEPAAMEGIQRHGHFVSFSDSKSSSSTTTKPMDRRLLHAPIHSSSKYLNHLDVSTKAFSPSQCSLMTARSEPVVHLQLVYTDSLNMTLSSPVSTSGGLRGRRWQWTHLTEQQNTTMKLTFGIFGNLRDPCNEPPLAVAPMHAHQPKLVIGHVQGREIHGKIDVPRGKGTSTVVGHCKWDLVMTWAPCPRWQDDTCESDNFRAELSPDVVGLSSGSIAIIATRMGSIIQREREKRK